MVVVPALLSAEELAQVLNLISPEFSLSLAEVSLSKSIFFNREKLQAYRKSVNRLRIGVQFL